MPGALISNGAAYRIRTYDVLIRSQTLYPAEVTPRLVDYYAHGLNNRQAFFKKVIEFDFYSFDAVDRLDTFKHGESNSSSMSTYKKSLRYRRL